MNKKNFFFFLHLVRWRAFGGRWPSIYIENWYRHDKIMTDCFFFPRQKQHKIINENIICFVKCITNRWQRRPDTIFPELVLKRFASITWIKISSSATSHHNNREEKAFNFVVWWHQSSIARGIRYNEWCTTSSHLSNEKLNETKCPTLTSCAFPIVFNALTATAANQHPTKDQLIYNFYNPINIFARSHR